MQLGTARLFPMPVKEPKAEKPTYAVGDRVDKFCAKCQEERGHIVATITKRGQISRVSCPKCGVRSSFKPAAGLKSAGASAKASAPYDRTRTYRTGQHLTHPTYGPGEVTAVIEPQKIDVLFSDRVRRLIHSQAAA
jgi:transcription elongation factor Elf1